MKLTNLLLSGKQALHDKNASHCEHSLVLVIESEQMGLHLRENDHFCPLPLVGHVKSPNAPYRGLIATLEVRSIGRYFPASSIERTAFTLIVRAELRSLSRFSSELTCSVSVVAWATWL